MLKPVRSQIISSLESLSNIPKFPLSFFLIPLIIFSTRSTGIYYALEIFIKIKQTRHQKTNKDNKPERWCSKLAVLHNKIVQNPIWHQYSILPTVTKCFLILKLFPLPNPKKLACKTMIKLYKI